ncbi:unnamed protein product [Acanthosepion pharaonis]|uniref:Uncharacterized protein n=1 Tax=Acanthosepion pharaonis TaxID=158019 RepID=A0A812E6W1_ACAPH|nr:unnamed protein product [Sepia pharaonis]
MFPCCRSHLLFSFATSCLLITSLQAPFFLLLCKPSSVFFVRPRISPSLQAHFLLPPSSSLLLSPFRQALYLYTPPHLLYNPNSFSLSASIFFTFIYRLTLISFLSVIPLHLSSQRALYLLCKPLSFFCRKPLLFLLQALTCLLLCKTSSFLFCKYTSFFVARLHLSLICKPTSVFLNPFLSPSSQSLFFIRTFLYSMQAPTSSFFVRPLLSPSPKYPFFLLRKTSSFFSASPLSSFFVRPLFSPSLKDPFFLLRKTSSIFSASPPSFFVRPLLSPSLIVCFFLVYFASFSWRS